MDRDRASRSSTATPMWSCSNTRQCWDPSASVHRPRRQPRITAAGLDPRPLAAAMRSRAEVTIFGSHEDLEQAAARTHRTAWRSPAATG